MLPYFLSWPVINIIIYAFLDRQNGLVNGLMAFLGMSDDSSWYNIISIWPPLIVMINLWKGVGYQTVLFLAVISGISRDYYEASMLDGATKLQQARYITLPHLRFVVSVLLIMAMGNIFRGDFGLFYIVTRDSGTLYPVTDVIDTYVFRGLRVLNNFGMSTAAGFYQSIVGLILVLISNKVVTKIDPESAMF
jgi:putative aldouronate transport system permease protein